MMHSIFLGRKMEDIHLSLSEVCRKKYMSKLSKERGRHHRGAGAERNTRPMRTTRLRGTRNETISSLFDDRKFEKDKALQLMCGLWSIPVV